MQILTFDIEEWFHLLDHESTRDVRGWDKYESRIHRNMERIFNILEEHNGKATFFCLSWIAETYPEVIREIVERGYEIGSHTRSHKLVYEQKPKEFSSDLERSIKTLEDVSGRKVKYFRAPGFSICEENKWALQIISDSGIEVDSSIFPAKRAHGGFSSYKNPVPSIIQHEEFSIKELPINYTTFMGKPIIYSGGGYFRLAPYFLIKHFTKKAEYVMTYFHPRDFDINQPILPDLSIFRKFKSYVGISNSKNKLHRWLNDFEFIDISTAVANIDWTKAPRIIL